MTLEAVWQSKTNVGARDRRRRLSKVPPPGVRVLSLPMVPGRKTVGKGVDTEDCKRIRRRSTKGPATTKTAANLALVAVVGGGSDHPSRVFSSRGKGGELELLPSLLNSGIGEAPRGSIGACGSTGSILTDSTESERLFSGVTGLQATASRGLTGCLDHELAAEVEALTGGGNREGHRRSRPLAEYGVMILETLDSVFPVPGPAAESGGDGGLGTTSPPNSGGGNGGRHRIEPLAEDEVHTMGTLESGFSVTGQAEESDDVCGLGATSPLENRLSPGWRNSANANTGDISRSHDNCLDLKENAWSYCGPAAAITAAAGTSRRDLPRAAESQSELEPYLSSPCVGVSRDASRIGTHSTPLLESGRWVSSGESTDEGVPRETGRDDSVGDQQADTEVAAFGADFSLFMLSHLSPPCSGEERGRFKDALGEGEGRKDTTVVARARWGIVTLGDDASTALDGGGLLPTLTRPLTINNNNRSDNDSPPILLLRDFNNRETALGVHGAIHPPRSSSSLGVTPTGLLGNVVESGDAAATAAATTFVRLARDTPRALPGSESAGGSLLFLRLARRGTSFS